MEVLTFSLLMLMIALRAAIPILFASIGELLTERSGVINLGVEGVMAIGAVIGFAAAYYTNNPWIGIIAALIAGAVLGLIHAFLTNTLQTSQIVTGLVMVIVCEGMASFLGQRLGPLGKTLVGLKGPQLKDLLLPGSLNQNPLTYLCFFLLIITWLYICKTRFGLELRAVGEKPSAADPSGINVNLYRYLHTTIGAALMAVGGAYLPLVYTPGWSQGMSGGRGWIAICLVIVSRWNPLMLLIGGILFGGIGVLQYELQTSGFPIPSQLLKMLPYLTAIVVLVIATLLERKQKAEPASLGKIYTRE